MSKYLPKNSYELIHENGDQPMTFNVASDFTEKELKEHIQALQKAGQHPNLPFTIKKVAGFTTLPPHVSEAMNAAAGSFKVDNREGEVEIV